MYPRLSRDHSQFALTIASYNYSYIRLAHLRIRYAPREYCKRYANTFWAARMRYAICEYAVGAGLREYDMRYVNRLRAMSNCKVAFSATIALSNEV